MPADVALREIRFGRVWRANACRVIEERDDLVVLWSPPGIARIIPVDAHGAEIRIPRSEWELGERLTVLDSLCLVRPGVSYSLWLHWDEPGSFSHWYVNFERPLGRTTVGWDFLDDKLDLIVRPDGSVRWKDEDELDEAARLGLLDAAAIRAEAERVLADPPWPTGWEDFRPNPSWPAPRLPKGWEVVDLAQGSQRS